MKKFKMIFTLVVALLIVGLAAGMVAMLVHQSAKGTQSPVYSTRMIEAGDSFDPQIFLRDESKSFTVSEDSVYDVNVPGDYTLVLLINDGTSRTVTLQVRDTVAPKVVDLPVMLVKKGGALLPDELIPAECVIDVTSVKATFLGSVDTSTEGIHNVSLRVEDTSGNTVRVDASYYVTDALLAGYRHEIGTPLPLAETLLPGCSALQIGEESIPSVPGKVSMKVQVFGGEYVLYYTAVDTVPPVGTVKSNFEGFFVGNTLPEDPMYFIESIADATAVSISYAEEYILDKAEQKEIAIVLTDLGGNTTTLSLTISVFEGGEGEDRVPPVISGVKDLETYLGIAPDYLAGISVYDGRDGAISKDRVKVDLSAVNLSVISPERGYPVVYSVTDASGNTATVTAYVTVLRPEVTEEQMNACFDKVMSGLDTKGLSRFSVLSLVYDYLTDNYRFTSDNANTDGSDYRAEAYWAFTLKNGNYESYTAMTSVILDRLGVEYFRVERQRTGSVPHSWLLVDYGIGWLYMDCSPLEGYIWTKDGKVYKDTDPAASALSAADIRDRCAMTDEDIAGLTALLNGFEPGWNYYKADLSGGILPVTATRNENGGYVSPKYKINYLVSGSNGKIEGASVQTVTHGAKSTTVTAVATNPGYRFVRWSDGLTTATRSDVVNKNITLTAEFELFTIDKHTVSYKSTSGGSISGTAVQQKRYNETTSTVTAVASVGYYFVKWSDGLTTASRSDRVTADAEYTAEFAPMMFLTYKAEEGGSIVGTTTQMLIPGTTGQAVTALPDKGYLFVSWSDGITTPQRKDACTESATFKATFKKDTASYTLVYFAGEYGKIEGKASQSGACWTQGSAVKAVAKEGYRFVKWSDGVTDPSRSDLILENLTVEAIFEPLPTYMLTYQAEEGGRIEGESLQSVIDGQTGSPVTAVAEEGYEFVSWSDGSIEPTRQDAPAVDTTLTALFKKVEQEQTFVLSYSALEGGTVEGECTQSVKAGQQGSQVRAVAAEGYRFVCWSDGITDETRCDTASSNLTVNALFEQIPPEEEGEEADL